MIEKRTIKIALLLGLGSTLATQASATTLPTSKAGYAMMQEASEDFSRYRSVDAVCVNPDHNLFTALANRGDGTAEFLALDNRNQVRSETLKIGEPDAGASQIHYELSDPSTGNVYVRAHYINPGALGDPDRIAMSTLSSFWTFLGDGTFRCTLDPQIVYLGVASDRKFTVMSDDDGMLSLLDADGKPSPATGFWSVNDAGVLTFSFLEGEELTTIKANPSGELKYPAWRVGNALGRQYGNSPQAYVAADMAKLGKPEHRIPYALAVHFDQLEICNHLAGEVSGNGERDAQVAESWQKAGCEGLDERHRAHTKQFAEVGPIAAFLERRSPPR